MRKIDELLDRFLDRIGQSEGAPYVGMFRGWREIVGDRIADHAEPVDIRSHALVVEADHPGWVQMVMMERQRILSQIGRKFPELSITALHVRVTGDRAQKLGEQATPDAQPAEESGEIPVAPVKPSADESEALERIGDDDLRSTLEHLRNTLGSSSPGDE